jgi:hypothetical protein
MTLVSLIHMMFFLGSTLDNGMTPPKFVWIAFLQLNPMEFQHPLQPLFYTQPYRIFFSYVNLNDYSHSFPLFL